MVLRVYLSFWPHVLCNASTMADKQSTAADDKCETAKADAPKTDAPKADAAPAEKKHSAEELAKHKSEENCWIAIEGVVYDVTKVEI